MSSWGGRRVMAARAKWADRLPLPCLRCGETVWPHDDWHIGHRYPRATHPELTNVEANQWPEHASCNTTAGATIPHPPVVNRRPW